MTEAHAAELLSTVRPRCKNCSVEIGLLYTMRADEGRWVHVFPNNSQVGCVTGTGQAEPREVDTMMLNWEALLYQRAHTDVEDWGNDEEIAFLNELVDAASGVIDTLRAQTLG